MSKNSNIWSSRKNQGTDSSWTIRLFNNNNVDTPEVSRFFKYSLHKFVFFHVFSQIHHVTIATQHIIDQKSSSGIVLLYFTNKSGKLSVSEQCLHILCRWRSSKTQWPCRRFGGTLFANSYLLGLFGHLYICLNCAIYSDVILRRGMHTPETHSRDRYFECSFTLVLFL